MSDLTMLVFLTYVDQFGIDAKELMIADGYVPKVIYRKAEKAVQKGYADCGVVPDRPWLTAKGRAFLEAEG